MLTIPHRDHTIFLRPWLETDIPSLVRHANNPNVACNMTDSFPDPYTQDNGKQFFERVKSAVPANVLAIVIDGEACGSIGIFPQSDINRLNGEFGYWLSEQYWNKGIATETVKAMVRYVFENFPLQRIFARPFEYNIGSQKVLEKAGFKLEARISKSLIKNGVVMDEMIYATRREYLDPSLPGTSL